jgi:hypothetical protein
VKPCKLAAQGNHHPRKRGEQSLSSTALWCHYRRKMAQSDNQTRPLAGGFFIAAGAIFGAFAGIFRGEPSAGLVIGLAIGTAIAAVIWLRNR